MRSQTNEIVSWRALCCTVKYAFDCGVCVYFLLLSLHQYKMNRKCLKKWRRRRPRQQQKTLAKNETSRRWLYKVHRTILYTNLWQAENANRFVHEINVIKPNKIYKTHIGRFRVLKLHSKWIERAQYYLYVFVYYFNSAYFYRCAAKTKSNKTHETAKGTSKTLSAMRNKNVIYKWVMHTWNVRANFQCCFLCVQRTFFAYRHGREKKRETFFS